MLLVYMFCSFYLILYIIRFYFSSFYYFDYYQHQYFTSIRFHMFLFIENSFLDHLLECPIGPSLKVVQYDGFLTGSTWRLLCLNFSALPAIHVLRSVSEPRKHWIAGSRIYKTNFLFFIFFFRINSITFYFSWFRLRNPMDLE